MSKIKIFIKKDCPLCGGIAELEQKIKEHGKQIEHFDLETADGLAEASFYTVLGTPTIIISDEDGNEKFSWRGQVPSLKNILDKC